MLVYLILHARKKISRDAFIFKEEVSNQMHFWWYFRQVGLTVRGRHGMILGYWVEGLALVKRKYLEDVTQGYSVLQYLPFSTSEHKKDTGG